MRFLSLPSVLLTVLLFSGCAATRVSQDYDTAFHFEFTSSYNWDPDNPENLSGSDKENQLLANRFKNAIENTLYSLGFEVSDKPDLLISYTYSVVQRLETDPFYPSFGYEYGWFGRHGGLSLYSTTGIYQYSVGELTISFYYGKTHDLVWRGVGTRDVFTRSSPEAITKEVNDMVASVLAQFPPAR
jgi:hypothetical protein